MLQSRNNNPIRLLSGDCSRVSNRSACQYNSLRCVAVVDTQLIERLPVCRPYITKQFVSDDQKCIHLPPNSGQTSVNFDIHLGKCGMTSSDATGLQTLNQQQQQQPNGLYIENTIIIQYDPLVQEIYDQARKLRCTWYDYYEKSVTFRPYNVDMLDAVTANFLGDNIQCWMQIQVGKGPWSSEVAGIVKIGQTMTMVLAIKDDENRFDMLVRNCVAHDGKHQPIQLVDEYGCVARPKIMAKFQKVRNFGPAATVASYAHFQAFKFPDSMSVHFQCVIQVCRYECPEPVCPGSTAGTLSSGSSATAPSSTVGGESSGQADYATSGTEMVAAKELPMHASSSPATNQQAYQQLAPPYINHSPASQHSVLKLDESQGRVQVKLDTSIMAGASNRINPHGAALNGTLSHTTMHGTATAVPSESNQHQQLAPGLRTTYLNPPGYYRPSTSTSDNRVAIPLSSGHARVGSPVVGPLMMSASTSTGTQQQQQGHYSTQYPQLRRTVTPAYATHHRLGDLSMSTAETTKRETPDTSDNSLADGEGRLISLMAAPRGIATMAASNHRYRRAVNQEDLVNATQKAAQQVRNGRHLSSQDSTSIQTQKTIQVVSPDDVAFSLQTDQDSESSVNDFFVESNENKAQASGRSVSRSKTAQYPASSSVCFSTARLLVGTMVTLFALVSGIIAVTLVILRQRSRIERKLSTVYDECPTATMHTSPVYEDPLRGHVHFQGTPTENLDTQQMRELNQRWIRLSRLCSQFTPSLYWR